MDFNPVKTHIVQDKYQQALKFAAVKHQGQLVKGTDNVPYLVHVCNVAMEVMMASVYSPQLDLEYAVQVALLHDVLEDTDTTEHELIEIFGTEVTKGVLALTKNEALPENIQLADSVLRIKNMLKQVGAVKLADRITNLQPPPAEWTTDKKLIYLQESVFILDSLGTANEYLATRLDLKIKAYSHYIH